MSVAFSEKDAHKTMNQERYVVRKYNPNVIRGILLEGRLIEADGIEIQLSNCL